MAETIVEGLEEILLLPVRLCPQGTLRDQRYSADVAPEILLEHYVEAMSGGAWSAQEKGYFEPSEALRQRLRLNSARRYAEFVYFHPFIRKILFDPSSPVRVLSRDDIGGVEITITKGRAPVRLQVPRIQLFLFPTDVAILAVQLSGAGTALPMDTVLRILNSARRTFPPFFMDGGESGQCPFRMSWLRRGTEEADAKWHSDFDNSSAMRASVLKGRAQPIASHWRALLDPLKPSSECSGSAVLGFEQFEDDRVPVLAYVPVAGTDEVRRQDQVRLALLEEPSDQGLSYPYSQKFLDDFEARHCYDRFYEPPRLTTRYFLTSYSFTLMGRKNDWFFRELVRGHFEQHYFVMVLLAQAQKAALLVFWERLSEISDAYAKAPAGTGSRDDLRRSLKCLIGDFADFAARFWFSEVSNQVQPSELFDRYCEHLGSRRLFSEVKEQIELMREVQMAADVEEHARIDNRFTLIQQWWFPLLLATGILGMDSAFQDVPKWLLSHGCYIWTREQPPVPYEFTVRFCLLIGLWALCARLMWRLPRWWDKCVELWKRISG